MFFHQKMNFIGNNEQKMTDLIFAGRNKSYGAYALRSAYGNTLARAVFFMFSGVSLVMGVSYYLSRSEKPAVEIGGQVLFDSIYTVSVNLPEDKPEAKPEPPQKPYTPPAGNAQQNMHDLVRVTDQDTAEAVRTESASVSGSVTTSTVTDGTGTVVTEVVLTGTPDTLRVIAPKMTHEVDTNAVYKGGLSALYRFISQNLKYPVRAYQDGKEGVVYVQFVVDEQGRVTRPKNLNIAGYGMDEEALRVISMIPPFESPAKAKGRPVKVYFSIPIKFRIGERY